MDPGLWRSLSTGAWLGVSFLTGGVERRGPEGRVWARGGNTLRGEPGRGGGVCPGCEMLLRCWGDGVRPRAPSAVPAGGTSGLVLRVRTGSEGLVGGVEGKKNLNSKFPAEI